VSIESRVLEFIRQPGNDAEFTELALDVFAYQYESVPMYRRFCDTRGAAPGSLGSYEQIPALPADAFKHGLCEAERPVRVFLSSGTTSGSDNRSRHALASLGTYKTAALAWFDAMVLPDAPGPLAVLVLGPTADTHPSSSLGQMFSWCVERCSNGTSLAALDHDGRVDAPAALDWLEARAAGSAPVLVLAVSSALTAVLEALRDRGSALRLPADSRVVDTGGRKGKARVLSSAGLLKATWRWLHVPAYLTVNEYGMTEMLSQFYDDALESRVAGRLSKRAKIAPPWVRTTIVDPVTLEPVEAGATGLLRHFDLANWESVSALQTLDLGRALGRGFELRGRAEGADARGCSALVAEIVGDDTSVE
jgi:hypothetical protein